MNKQVINNEEGRKEKLISAGIELFAEYGYDKVSIRQIAAVAGVNSSMISYYFNGKNGLYEAIIKEVLQNFDSFINFVSGADIDPRKGFELYVRAVNDIHQKYPPHFVKLIYREMLNPSTGFENVAVARLRRNFEVLLNMIERGKAQGIFRKDLDNEKILLMFVSVINFYFLVKPLHSRIIKQDSGFAGSYLKQVLDIFFNGIEVKCHDEK